jgi:hypothetical protein
MNMHKLMAMAEQLKAEPKKEKPRYRVRNGKIVIRMRATLAKPEPKRVSNVFQLLPKERSEHHVGQACPHCLGKKRYSWHVTDKTEKCFRCHGKGFLDARDLAFLRKRQQEGRAICHIVTA